MLLPYASYLRVYEPATDAGSPADHPAAGLSERDGGTALALSTEQRTVLTTSLASAMLPPVMDELAGAYTMRRDGALYVCPVDLALRSWLALVSFADDTDAMTRALFFAQDPGERPAEEFVVWRMANPTANPHIRQATWGVPRAWFLLVAQEERELYDLEGESSVRFRAPVADARRRLQSAYGVLDATIDDVELIDELEELGHWLASFADESWLELDYAGVARLLGDELAGDRSAYEITSALRAIQRHDFAVAGETYRHFVERWRIVNALERAN